jgi:hypothetical protein
LVKKDGGKGVWNKESKKECKVKSAGKIVLLILSVMVLISLNCCLTRSNNQQKVSGDEKIMTIEEMAKKANVMYGDQLKAGETKEIAMKKVVEFLQSQKNVKEVNVTGSQTLHVFFTDGNDLLMMLGEERM